MNLISRVFLESITKLPDLSKNGVDPLEVFEDVEEVATSKSGSSFMIAIYCWSYLK